MFAFILFSFCGLWLSVIIVAVPLGPPGGMAVSPSQTTLKTLRRWNKSGEQGNGKGTRRRARR